MTNISIAAERFIHTNVLSRQNVKTTTNEKQKVSFLIITMGLLLMMSFFFFLWVRICIIETGYQLSTVHKKQEMLLQENRKLKIERTSLRVPDRIEAIARKKLGMSQPGNNQMIILE